MVAKIENLPWGAMAQGINEGAKERVCVDWHSVCDIAHSCWMLFKLQKDLSASRLPWIKPLAYGLMGVNIIGFVCVKSSYFDDEGRFYQLRYAPFIPAFVKSFWDVLDSRKNKTYTLAKLATMGIREFFYEEKKSETVKKVQTCIRALIRLASVYTLFENYQEGKYSAILNKMTGMWHSKRVDYTVLVDEASTLYSLWKTVKGE